jgi:hypothetical protein
MKSYSHAWWMSLGLLISHSGVVSAQVIQSTFTSGLEGWTGNGGSITWSATGGNPGGHLQQMDVIAGDMFVIAPVAFLGNRSAFVGGTLSFDARQVVGIADYDPFGTVTLRNGATAISADIAPPVNPTASWSTFSVTLNASSFGTTPLIFDATLANLTAIEVMLESQNGVETVGFDNFQIAAVPEPSSILMLGSVAVVGSIGVLRYRRRQKALVKDW